MNATSLIHITRPVKNTKSGGEIAYGVAAMSELLKIIGLFAEYSLFYKALLRTRPILRSLLIVATP